MAGFYKNVAFKKCLLIVVWGVTLFAIGFGISFYRGVGQKFDKVVEVPIEEISLKGVEDGTYIGEYEYETLYAKVQVVVKNEDIKKIVLDEYVTAKKNDAENIIPNIVDADSIMIDDISGATDSCRVIKLAVADALSPGAEAVETAN